MPKLGLSIGLSNTGKPITPGIVTSNLVMKHMYPAGAVQPVVMVLVILVVVLLKTELQ